MAFVFFYDPPKVVEEVFGKSSAAFLFSLEWRLHPRLVFGLDHNYSW